MGGRGIEIFAVWSCLLGLLYLDLSIFEIFVDQSGVVYDVHI